MITCDEYTEHFGGNERYHANLEQGENSYSSKAPIRFSREQWVATCEDTTIQRPHYV